MSSILSADDLNDFLTPGIACIKPTEVKKSSSPSGPAEIEISIDGAPVEVVVSQEDSTESRKTLEAAQISLSDCLACTGCITSAEEVLVAQHSHTQVLKALRDPDHTKTFVVSISHQVRASLATAFNLDTDTIDIKLKDLFVNKLGFKYVVGMEIGRAIAIEAGINEVVSRLELGDSTKGSPILSSVCPGWTCYAEKSHPEVVPYLSQIKSPQQITACLVKKQICEDLKLEWKDIYHLSVMPCFDKKLEAARPEFTTHHAPDTDCVITAKEVVQLMLDENIDITTLGQLGANSLEALSDVNLAPQKWPVQYQWQSNQGSSSGGYMFYILRAIKQRYKEIELQIQVIPGKNSDTVECRLVDEREQKTIANVSQVYGFRNIQNMVRKFKTKKVSSRAKVVSRKASTAMTDPLDMNYIEVMACPGGCINGGGLVGKPDDKTLKEWRAMVEENYKAMTELDVTSAMTHQWLQELWGYENDRDLDALIKVEYRAVDESVAKAENPALTLGTHW